MGVTRPGVVASSGQLARGALDPLRRRWPSAAIFSEIRPHATEELCARAGSALAGADAVVGLGGGSALGIGKAAAVTLAVPLIAVPTTYSGSEMTAVYGITRDGRKHVLHDHRALPATVLYDPALTDALPARETFASLMNCLAHCLECAWEEPGNEPLVTYALDGVRHLARGVALLDGPRAASGREHLLAAGREGGAVLAAGRVGVHHTICHAIGGLAGGSHGEINAVVLPAVMAATAAQATEIQTRLTTPLRGLAGIEGPPDVIVARLRDRWRLPRDLATFDIGADDVPTLVAEITKAQTEQALHVRLDEPGLAAVIGTITRAHKEYS